MIEFKKSPDEEEDIRGLLHPFVREWFGKKFGSFCLPQRYAVLGIHSRSNVLISAPTGSGKTLTAFLSILNELVDSANKGILLDKTYCIYVSPLKALGNDISVNLVKPLKEIEEIAGKKLGIRIHIRTGDTSPAEKQKMLKNPPHIIITTPESLALMLASIKFKEHLNSVEWFVADEVHALAENKRGVHLSLSMERLQRLSKGMCRVGLSATISPLEEVAKFLVGNGRKCKIIDVRFIKDMDLKVLSPVPDLINTSYEKINKETYRLIDSLIQSHKTTLIFTNTRSGTERVVHNLKTLFPDNYYEIDEGPPTKVAALIGAHHGSLSKEHRFKIESALRDGKLKAVCCSTSLELGIDIGYIDLVICLGSPKSVARFLQRAGRAGHKLHEKVKGRIIVQDRDDLVECSVLLKCAVEHNIDRIHIPKNCLDVLAQQLVGIIVDEQWEVSDLYSFVKKSYCFADLDFEDFDGVLSYLAGEFVSLEDRHIYAKIWYDRDTGRVGRKGKLSRVIYMTNIGTIPDQHGVIVKVGTVPIGSIDEMFLEKLRRGDIFVLGGDVYEFLYAKGMVAHVRSATGRKPTVPSWVSEMLPLSFDLAEGIQHFRKLIAEKFYFKKRKPEILEFIKSYLYIDDNGAQAIYSYFREQHKFMGIPHESQLYIEDYVDYSDDKHYVIFHSLFGRRVNDALARAVAFAISRSQHRSVEMGIRDNGFYVSYEKNINVLSALKLVKAKELKKVLELAIERSEILKRRFRHCAARSLMILRNYKGRSKRVGRQQVSSMILLNAVRRISNDFPILKEARREVLEDVMDVKYAVEVFERIEKGKIKLKQVATNIPSPFSFNIIAEGYSDILKIEDRQEFLRRLHAMVLARIGQKADFED